MELGFPLCQKSQDMGVYVMDKCYGEKSTEYMEITIFK